MLYNNYIIVKAKIKESGQDRRQTMSEETKTTTFLKGFPLTGEEISGFKDKTFSVLDVRQEVMPKYKNPEETELRTILMVKVNETGEESEYYANRTSISTLIKQFKTKDASTWIGKKAEWKSVEGRNGWETYIKEKL